MLCVMDGRFMMASMGEAEEKLRAQQKRQQKEAAYYHFYMLGGKNAGGNISLYADGKTSAALKRHSDEGFYT